MSLPRDALRRWLPDVPALSPLRLGVVIGPRGCAIAGARRDGSGVSIVGAGPGEFESPGTVAAEIIGRIPRARFGARRHRVIVALADQFVQVRPIFGLPAGLSREIAAAVIREDPWRHFRRTAPVLRVSVVTEIDGREYAGAYDAALVGAIEASCRRHGLLLEAIVPETIGAVTSARSASTEADLLDQAMEVAVLGERDPRRILRAPRPIEERDQVSARRGSWSVAITASVAIASLTLPLAVGRAELARARASRDAIASSAAPAIAALRDLNEVTSVLSELGAESTPHASAVELLEGIAAALPAESAMTRFQVDSGGARISLITPSAEAAMRALGALPGHGPPQLMATVARERAGDRVVERIELKFARVASDGGRGR